MRGGGGLDVLVSIINFCYQKGEKFKRTNLCVLGQREWLLSIIGGLMIVSKHSHPENYETDGSSGLSVGCAREWVTKPCGGYVSVYFLYSHSSLFLTSLFLSLLLEFISSPFFSFSFHILNLYFINPQICGRNKQPTFKTNL